MSAHEPTAPMLADDTVALAPAVPLDPLLAAAPTARLAAYAAPSVPIAALAIPLLAYIPTMYATAIGLPLAVIGSIFLIVRLADIVFDPVVGALMDRSRSRFGRFKPWLAAGTVPLVAAVVMLFNPPAGAGAGWLVIALGGVYAGYSICYLAHLSWGATLSADYAGRSRVFAWWQAGMLLGSITVLATPILAEAAFGLSQATGVAAMGWLIAILLPLTVAVALLVVPERGSVAASPPTARLADYFALMRRATVLRLLVADLLIGTAIGMNSALFFFYFGMVKQNPPLTITLLLFLNLCGSLCGTPIWSFLTPRLGKHGTASLAFSLYALSLLVIALMPLGLVVGCAILFLAGLTLSAGPMLLRSMMADAGDEELLRTGHDRTGLLSALFSGTNKLGLALAPGITFTALGWAGFDAQGPNGAGALATLTALYIAVPAALGLVTALVIRGHPLTAERHRAILAELG